MGWKLSVLLNANGESVGLHDQDFIHNGKKLINPLDSPAKTLQLGMDVACIQHIEGIYNKFKLEEHGLKQEDIVRKDRQNWGSAQRICQQRVQNCLEVVRGMGMHQERTLGTQTYLSICSDYIDLFLSPLLDLRSKIVVAARVCFFLRLWRLWIKHGNHGVGGNSMTVTLADCFVSNQCFIDITMSCHFIVLSLNCCFS